AVGGDQPDFALGNRALGGIVGDVGIAVVGDDQVVGRDQSQRHQFLTVADDVLRIAALDRVTPALGIESLGAELFGAHPMRRSIRADREDLVGFGVAEEDFALWIDGRAIYAGVTIADELPGFAVDENLVD